MARAISALWFTLAAAFVAAAPASAQNGPVSATDAKAIKAVVEAQLDAFAADDAERAFSYAAPSIRSMFGTPDRFMTMVRSGYPVVYRPASVTFLAPVRVDGQIVQGVHLTDGAGTLWLAIYQLERQPDKSWRIAGCMSRPRRAR